MSEEFYCGGCGKHKSIAARSNKKTSNTYVCNSCFEKMSKNVSEHKKEKSKRSKQFKNTDKTIRHTLNYVALKEGQSND